MASSVYPTAMKKFIDNDIDFVTDTIDVMLVDNGYTYDQTDEFVSDLSASELSATNYARQVLGSKTVTVNAGSVEIDAADVAFGALGGAANDTIGGAVIYKDAGGADSANAVIAFIDVSDLTTNGSSVTLQFAAPISTLANA